MITSSTSPDAASSSSPDSLNMRRISAALMRTIGNGDRLMTSGPGIRAQVAKFLARELDADQFEDWIVQNTWNIHQDPDESLQRLAYAIDAALAEYSSGHIDEPELRRKLIP